MSFFEVMLHCIMWCVLGVGLLVVMLVIVIGPTWLPEKPSKKLAFGSVSLWLAVSFFALATVSYCVINKIDPDPDSWLHSQLQKESAE